MKKKMIYAALITAIFSFLFALGAYAAEETYVEGVFTYTVEDGKATIVKCEYRYDFGNNVGHLIIPESLGGYPVVAIGESVFDAEKNRDLYDLNYITLPSSLERVGKNNYIRNIHRFYINSIKTWLNIDFEDLSLKNTRMQYSLYIDDEIVYDVVIPESITEIKPYTFYRCGSIKSITMSKNMKVIGSKAFQESGLEKVYVDSLETWFNIDFYSTPMYVANELYVDGELATGIEVPESITTINYGDITSLGTLDYLKIHKNVSVISNGAINDVKIKNLYIDSIEHYIVLMTQTLNQFPDGSPSASNPMRVADNLYIGGEIATELVIPEGVEEIPCGCFEYLKSIKKISLPSSIKKINRNAFFSMPDTKEISVPDTETWFRICDDLADATGSKRFERLYIGDEEAETLVVPDYIEKLPYYAFTQNKNLKNLVLSNSIKDFNKAFYNYCDYIENVYVDSLETWLGYDFGYISGKPMTVAGNPMTVAENLYVGGELLTDLVIPDGTTEIGINFYGCESIKTVTVPASVTKIADIAFYGCNNIKAVYAESLESWLNIEFVSEYSNPLFSGADLYIDGELLTEVELPEEKSEFKKYTFYGCKSLEKLVITDNVTQIGKRAFHCCVNMDIYVDTLEHWLSFDFKDGYTPMFSAKSLYIADKQVTELIIPESIKSIPAYAFACCNSLKRVEVPATTKIGNSAFKSSGLVEAVIGTATGAQAEPVMVIKDAYSWFLGCSDIERLIIGNGVKEIADKAFYNSVALKEIIICDGVETIGEFAFSGSHHITSVSIPTSVKTVGQYAFSDCKMLSSITLGDKVGGTAVTQIGYKAFYNCTALKNITLNTGVKTFGKYVFEKSNNIENLYINDLVSYLNVSFSEMLDQAATPTRGIDNFYVNGKILKNLVIPEGVTKICDYAFSRCKTLESIKFPSTLKKIGDCAFENCINLKEVNFPDSLMEIGELSFFSCNKIKSIIIPRRVKSIGLGAFESCKALEYVVFYEKLSTAGEHAFQYCENLKQILYTGTEAQWMTFVTKNYNSGVANVPYYCEYDPDALFSPKNLSATQTSSSITVKWSAVNGATGYRVFVKNTQTGKWDIAVRTTGKKTTATISNLKPGSKYSFAVKAYINTGALIMWSPGYSELNTLTRPVVTDKVTSSQKTDSITLNWNKVQGATGYRIYVVRNGSWKALKTTTELTYTATDLTPGTKYTFAVKAYTKYGGTAYWASKYAKYVTSTRTKTPSITKITAGTGNAKLTWSDVSGETGYQVWYSTSKDGSYKKFSNVKANATSLTVTGLTSGKTYYFKVRTYIKTDSGYVYSAWSSVKSVTIK